MRKRTYRAAAVKLCETPPKPSREGGTQPFVSVGQAKAFDPEHRLQRPGHLAPRQRRLVGDLGTFEHPQPVLPEDLADSRGAVPSSHQRLGETRVARRVEVANGRPAGHHIHCDADVILSDQPCNAALEFGWKVPLHVAAEVGRGP